MAGSHRPGSAGNYSRVRGDLWIIDLLDVDEDEPMSTCHDARELISAALDGEADLDTAPEHVRRHLAECAECAQWADEAEHVNRLLRVSTVVDDDAGLAESVLAQVRLPRRGRWQVPLRVALALVALAQLTIGLASLLGPIGMSSAMPDSAHMNHEEAAFNIAFGIALVTVVWNGRRAAGQVPVLAAFVLILAVTSAFDLLDGNVTWPRLATHLPILLGLVLAAVIGRTASTEPGPHSEAQRLGSGLSRRTSDTSPRAVPLLSHRNRSAPPPAAHRDVA